MPFRRTAVVVTRPRLPAATAACSGGGEPKPVAAVTPKTMVSEGTVTTEGAPLAPLTGLPDSSGATKSRAIAGREDRQRPRGPAPVRPRRRRRRLRGGRRGRRDPLHRHLPLRGAADLAGPVRSVRPMDPDILAAYHGLFAYSGGIPAFVSLMRKAPVQDVNVDVATDAYSWDKARRAPHNTVHLPGEALAQGQGRQRRARRRPCSTTGPAASPSATPTPPTSRSRYSPRPDLHLRLGRRLRHLEADVQRHAARDRLGRPDRPPEPGDPVRAPPAPWATRTSPAPTSSSRRWSAPATPGSSPAAG